MLTGESKGNEEGRRVKSPIEFWNFFLSYRYSIGGTDNTMFLCVSVSSNGHIFSRLSRTLAHAFAVERVG